MCSGCFQHVRLNYVVKVVSQIYVRLSWVRRQFVFGLVSCSSFVDLGGEWDFHCMGEVMPNSDYGA
ncbi:hypothetical protein A2U01_0050946 [Trifolium medium]|uniref:Uncharacterized protein n=1 Tax=Trifolium medium TaxID=97028 RepID=A0A392R0G2_9FABA|nr:hypothetical protein [Trifolium medium]